jgi:hypothetical protein
VEKFSSGRCFLAGDSAHIHTPAGGQGMNTGIQDAYNLAWKLALVLKGAAHERILDSYNEERLPNARRLLQTTDRMFNLAAGTDWLVNLIRTTIFPPMARFILSLDAVKKNFFPLISQIGISYRESSLSMPDSDRDFEVRAGDRLPYFLLDGHSIYDRLRAPKFHLLTFYDGLNDEAGDRGKIPDAIGIKHADLLDRYRVPLNPQIADLFGTDKAFQVFLRPDNYIAYISSDTTPQRLVTYLNEIIG